MKRFTLLLFMLTFSVNALRAQSLIKEAMNSFASYGQSQKIADLEKARKFIDDAYTTRRDSLGYRNNLTRALIYSTLAVIDSNRKYTYKKDPVEETEYCLGKLRSQKFLAEHEPEISFIRKQLAEAYLLRANKALSDSRFYEALTEYKKVYRLSEGESDVIHNLAVLSERLNFKEDAVQYYEELIEKKEAGPEYYLTVADLYTELNDPVKMQSTLQRGHRRFPQNRDILFKLLNTYTDQQDYQAIVTIINDAINLDPDNVNLNYLAGFAHEMTGNRSRAETYYKKTLELDPNSYEGNYALGLLYLNSYFRNTKKDEQMFLAKEYLTKANEINSNDVKGLRALVVLYKETGDMLQLQKLNNKLNELILN